MSQTNAIRALDIDPSVRTISYTSDNAISHSPSRKLTNLTIVIANGVSPKPIITGISKGAYAKLPLPSRPRFAHFESDSWISSYTVYYRADVSIPPNLNANIIRYRERTTFLSFDELLPTLIGHILTPLPTAIAWGCLDPAVTHVVGGVTCSVAPDPTIPDEDEVFDSLAELSITRKAEAAGHNPLPFATVQGEENEIDEPWTETDYRNYLLPRVHGGGFGLHTPECVMADRGFYAAVAYVGTCHRPPAVERPAAEYARSLQAHEDCDRANEAFKTDTTIGLRLLPHPLVTEHAHAQGYESILIPLLLTTTGATTIEPARSQVLGFGMPASVDNACNSVASAADSINALAMSVQSLIKAFSSFMTNTFPSLSESLLSDSLLFIDFVKSMYTNDIYTFSMSCLRLLTRCHVPTKIVEQFSKAFFGGGLEPSPPMQPLYRDEGDKPIFNSVLEAGLTTENASAQGNEGGSILFALIGTILTGSIADAKTMKNATDWCRTFNVVVPTMKNLSVLADTISSWLPKCCDAWVSAIFPPYAWQKFLQYEYLAFHDKVADFNTPEKIRLLKFDPTVQADFQATADQMKLYIKNVLNKPEISPKFAQLFLLDCKIVRELSILIATAKGETAFRKVPFSFSLFGPPNQGKSLLMICISKLLRPEGWSDINLIYCRDMSDPFWSRYNGNFVTLWDDGFAMNNEKTAEMVLEFLTIVSNVPKGLNMPSLDNPLVGIKGQSFMSEVVGISTNVPFPKPVGMECKEALWRRRHCLWHVNVKPEFCIDGVPQYDKLTKQQQNDMSYLTWRLHSATIDKDDAWITDPMETYDALKLTLALYKKHCANQDVLMGFYDEMPLVERIREEQRAVEQARAQMDCDESFAEFEDSFAKWFYSPSHSDIHTDEPCEDVYVEKDPGLGPNISEHKHTPNCKHSSPKVTINPYFNSEEFSSLPFREKIQCVTEKTFDDITSLSAACLNSLANGGGAVKPETALLHARLIADRKVEPILVNESEQRINDLLQQDRRFQTAEPYFDFVSQAQAVLNRVDNPKPHPLLEIICDYYNKIKIFMREHPIVKYVTLFSTAFASFFLLVRFAKNYFNKPVEESSHDEDSFFFPDPCKSCPCWSSTIQSTCGCKCHIARDQAAAGTGYNHKIPSKRVPFHNARSHQIVRARSHNLENMLAEMNISYDPNTPREIVDRYVTGVCRLHLPFQRNRQLCGYRFAGTFILTTKHFFMLNDDFIEEGEPLNVYLPGGPMFELKFSRQNMHELGCLNDRERDVVVYNLGPRVPAAPCRVKCFMLLDDCGHHDEQAGALLTVRHHAKTGVLMHDNLILPRVYYETMCIGEYQANSFSPHKFRNINAYAYFAPALDGDCGGIVLGCGKSTNRKILGIHVGIVDATGRCLSEPVFQEDLYPFLDTHAGSTYGLIEKPSVVLDRDPIKFNASAQSFSILGAVDDKHQIHMPTKTALIKSPYFECFGKTKFGPSVLHPSDDRLVNKQDREYTPLIAGVLKYSKQSGYFKDSHIAIAFEQAKQYWGISSKPQSKVSLAVAINGAPAEPKKQYNGKYIKGLDFGTSSGYPFNLRNTPKKKGDLISGEKPNAYISDKELKFHVEERIRLAKHGIQFRDSIWCDTMKDELRPLEKVAAGKTRLIANAPLSFTIVSRIYGFPFFSHFYESFRHTPSAVGMDPESGDWHDMISYLHECSSTGFAGDFGRFDGTLAPQLMYKFAELWNSFMGGSEDDQTVVNTLVNEMIHTTHICLDAVYIIHGGNPSGNACTVLINTFCNWMYFALAWLDLAPPDKQTMVAFTRYVRIKAYGDDCLVAVDPDVQIFYNMFSVRNFFYSHGIEFTPPSKDASETFLILPIVSFSFLCRNTVRHFEIDPVRWLAALDVDTIYSIIDWNRKQEGKPAHEIANENLNCALRFAFFHGHKFFHTLRQGFFEFANKHRNFPRPKLLTWVELLNQYSTHGAIYIEEAVTRESARSQSDEITLPMENQVVEGTPDLGVQMLQPEPTVMAPVTNVQPFADSRATSIIPERPWGLSEMTQRFSQVDHFTWSMSDMRFTIKRQYSIPFDLIFNNTTNVPFANFTLARFTTHIQATSTGPKTSQGKLLWFFTPGMNKAEAAARHATNLCAATVITNFGLGPNQSSAGLDIPFYNINSFMNIANPDPDVDFVGTLTCIVMNPLYCDPTGSITSVDVNLYCEFREAVFHLPQSDTLSLRRLNPLYLKELNVRPSDVLRRQQDAFRRENLSDSQFSIIEEECTMTLEEFEKQFPHIKIVEKARPQMGHSNSKGGDQDQSVKTQNTTTVYNIYEGETQTEKPSHFKEGRPPPPVTQNIGVIADNKMKGGKGGKSNSSATTDISPTTSVDASEKGEMDKPPSTFRLRQEEEPTTNWAHGSGLNYATRLDLSNKPQQLPDHEHFATGEDEMWLANIWQKTGFTTAIVTSGTSGTINSRTWNFVTISTTTPVNTILAWGYITPCAELFDPAILSNAEQRIFISNLCWASCKKSFNSGGIKLIFEFICTEFHNVDLVFTPHYLIYTTPPTDLGAATSQYSTYFKLGPGNSVFEVTIPNIFQRRFQRTPHGGAADKSTCIGLWSLRNVSQLNAPGFANSTIEGNVYIAGAQNFQAWGDYGNNKTLVPLHGQCLEQAHSQASAPTVSGAVAHDGHLLTNHMLTPPDGDHFGSMELDLRTSLKRMIPIGSYFYSEQEADTGGGPTHGYGPETSAISCYPHVLGVHTVSQILSHGLLGWFSPGYRYYRGSFQMAFLPTVTPQTLTATTATTMLQPTFRTTVTVDSNIQPAQLYSHNAAANRWDTARVNGTINSIYGTGVSSGLTTTYLGMTGSQYPYVQPSGIQLGDFWVQPFNGDTPTYPKTPFDVNTVNLTCYNSFPITLSKQTSDWHNVVIPHLSEYPVLYVPQASLNDGTGAAQCGAVDPNLKTHSSVILSIICDNSLFQNNSDGAPLFRVSYIMMGAIGDDFRMGGFLGPPSVTTMEIIIPGTSYGDLSEANTSKTPAGDNYGDTA